MSVAIRGIEGVEGVEVSLSRGLARIDLKPDNRVTVEQIRRLIRNNGFTPKQARVRVAGRLVESSRKLVLDVSGLDAVYALVDAPESRGVVAKLRTITGQNVVLIADLPERTPEGGQPTLFVHEMQAHR